jgi:triosephosphate isomerase
VLTGLRQKAGIWIVLVLMVIFTPLTFILALTNPVSDCGCFGDAIQLTNWQTFGKSIVLLAFTLILFTGRKDIRNKPDSNREWIIMFITTFLFILFNLANIRYLPLIDFLPYKTGVKIADKMIIPENMPADQYNTTFIYEKEGLRKEFTLENYPAEDTSWIFVDQKSVLIKKGYQPPIHDFSIISINGDDLTQSVLSDTSLSVLMIVKKIEEADSISLEKGFELGNYCINNGISYYILTASGTDEVNKYNNNGLMFCFTDETTLKTIVRSNPGYLMLYNGVIRGKWSWANLPGKEWFGEQVQSSGY